MDNQRGDRQENRRGARQENRRGSRQDDRRDDRRENRRGHRSDARTPREERHAPPGLQRRADEPETPEGYEIATLPIAVRAELKSLPTDLAAIVGAHLGAAGDLIVEDPARALRHARAARRMASRLTVTREALGEAAYAAGEWSEALNEFRALRRMTGDQVWLPVMADCERALGRPQAALRLAREAQEVSMHARDRVELHIVEAGARADLGQVAEARRLLRRTLESVPAKAVGSKVRAGYALAERLLADGDRNEAREIFRQVAGWDRDHATDAAERCDELDGMVLDLAPEEAGDQP